MIKIPAEANLDDYTLILPSIAVGNVGQLCIDLLIHTLNFSKIGCLWNSMFLPVCGLDPFNKNSTSICTACDFYVELSHKIIVLQLRSIHIGNLNSFFAEITHFVLQKKIKKIIILSSCYDYARVDRSKCSVGYLTSDNSLLDNDKLKNLSWKMHTNNIMTESNGKRYIDGSGFAYKLYEHISVLEIPCTILFRYCYEGDNILDAVILFINLNQWLNLVKDATDIIKYPPSWEYLFGNPPSSELY